MNSAIYEGTIRHRRIAERAHEFRHRIAMAYLDLGEVDEVVGGALTRARPGIVRFRRSDYLGDPGVPLIEAVRALVASRLGAAPQGPVRLLTHLRSFGHCFNPVSVYYCYAPGGERLEAIVAEVTNTPWGERHAYVLTWDHNPTDAAVPSGSFDKALHVSPFMGMDQRYSWRAVPPGAMLSMHIESIERGARVFDATLCLRRKPLNRRTLAWITVRYPAATQRLLILIYAHAVTLRLKGVRVKPHPGAQPP
ncbi:MAG: DUF1365 domain-containing protein [Pseudonocardiaceae bacterium]